MTDVGLAVFVLVVLAVRSSQPAFEFAVWVLSELEPKKMYEDHASLAMVGHHCHRLSVKLLLNLRHLALHFLKMHDASQPLVLLSSDYLSCNLSASIVSMSVQLASEGVWAYLRLEAAQSPAFLTLMMSEQCRCSFVVRDLRDH